jgi:hypothetical protein
VHCDESEAKRLAALLEGKASVLVPAPRTPYKLTL